MCGDGSVEIADAEVAKPRDTRNFEEFIYQVWGTGIAKHFAIPYNKNLWTVPLSEMETSWLGGFQALMSGFVPAQSEVSTKIRMRYLAGILSSDRITHDGKAYNVLSVIDPEMRHVELVLMCKSSA